jgi:hypothetical protein
MRENTETISGLGSVIKFFPIILPILILLFFKWRKNSFYLNLIQQMNIRVVVLGILIVSFASILGGPFITTLWYIFFSSIILTPLIIPLLSKKFLSTINNN